MFQRATTMIRKIHSMRFFTRSAGKSIGELCKSNPVVMSALKEEGLSIEALSLQGKGLFFHLEQLQRRTSLKEAFEKKYFKISHYALAEHKHRENVLRFFEFVENALEILKAGYVDINDIYTLGSWVPLFVRDHAQQGEFYGQLFNEKFVEHLLKTNRISVKDTIASKNLSKFCALSRLFYCTLDIEYYLKESLLTLDLLLTLNAEELDDLTTLLIKDSNASYLFSRERYFTMEGFLACNADLRRRFLWQLRFVTFLHDIKPDCMTLEAFLDLKPSTRKYFIPSDEYMEIDKFNRLDEKMQKNLRGILFTITGKYALRRRYITVDEFCSLPVNKLSYFSLKKLMALLDRDIEQYESVLTYLLCISAMLYPAQTTYKLPQEIAMEVAFETIHNTLFRLKKKLEGQLSWEFGLFKSNTATELAKISQLSRIMDSGPKTVATVLQILNSMPIGPIHLDFIQLLPRIHSHKMIDAIIKRETIEPKLKIA